MQIFHCQMHLLGANPASCHQHGRKDIVPGEAVSLHLPTSTSINPSSRLIRNPVEEYFIFDKIHMLRAGNRRSLIFLWIHYHPLIQGCRTRMSVNSLVTLQCIGFFMSRLKGACKDKIRRMVQTLDPARLCPSDFIDLFSRSITQQE